MIFNPVVIKKSGPPAGSASLKEVNFYDYDGTLLYSYTLSEVRTLMSLPKGPTHDGLVFQGWNWTLEKVKALTRPMNVGAMYITDDGKTRLKIRVWDTARSNVPLYISQTVSNGVTIDWGDGSSPETLEGTGNVNTSHQYAAGDYTISLAVADGCELGFGNGTESYCVMGSTGNNGKVYCNLLQEANIGDGVSTIGEYAFSFCQSLRSITIPNSVTSIKDKAFYSCYSLSSFTIPNRTIYMGGDVFRYCYSFVTITIPNDITEFANSLFRNCASLVNITLPDNIRIGANSFVSCYSLSTITIPNVEFIGSNAFSQCFGMAEYHLKSVIPPTLFSTSAFENIPSDCIIYVPVGSLEAYKTAENWSVYADYMQEEPT